LIPEEASQTKVAEVLSLIDTQIEATHALIAKQERVRAGLMQDLFTRGIDEHGQLRPPRAEAPHLYYQAELGWLPRGWKVEAFGERIEVIDPNPTHRYPNEIEEGVPICSTENFNGTDAFDISFAKHVPEATFVFQNNRCHYDPLDVIFARKGRIGLARRYGEDRKVFSHTVVTMKPLDQTVSHSWVLWLARSNAFLSGIAREMNSNSGVPTLGIEFIKSILVPFPPEPEHSMMATILDEASSAISVMNNDLSKLRLQKSGLMQDLLTGKVSVAPLLESVAA
jgi:type I restriction enzyme S subunit